MHENEYLNNRVEHQIAWYNNKSNDSQKKYKRIKYAIILTSASIPFLINLNIESIWIKAIVSLLSIVITISEGIVSLNKYNEVWIEYRTVCESLKYEKFMYLNKAGIYENKENSYPYFVERVESIISKENNNWVGINKPSEKDNNHEN
ncbi:DUF4231 domain-containing protein [Enterococcus sp. AZ177]|uniref:DUF4231 domain-containing protein n=1 Tax=unclassified Enterococcus TaxID=2608891 RepID=UPI003D2FE63D